MKSKLTIFLLFSIFLVGSCKKDEEETPTPRPPVLVTVSGEIKKSGTDIPVEGAIVSINDIFDTTNSEGKYTLSNVPAGDQTITVEKETFSPFIKTVEIPTTNFTYDIELNSTIPQVVSGIIKNSQSEGIDGAEISFGEYNATTNVDGAFEILDVIEGTYNLEISKADFEDYEEEITIVEGANELEFELTAEILPQVSNLTYTDGNYQVTLNWPSLSNETLVGYNIYVREWYYYEDDIEIILNSGFGPNTVNFQFGNWYLHEDNPVSGNQAIITTENFYTVYQFYVVPVNLDGNETPKNGATPIVETLLYANSSEGGLLGSFSLTE